MISHEHKCIFIHIQRTGGSSIEKWIVGNDWWNINKKTKHILASQAKKIYKDYWDDYFKFSFVRNPWDRMVSMTKFKDKMGVKLNNKSMVKLNKYKKMFGYPLTIEHDHRFYNRKKLINNSHKEYCVYDNILDEELDFVGTFENLYQDLEFIKEKLGIKKDFNVHKSKSKRTKKSYRDYYNKENKKEVYDLFYNDIVKYGYEF